jgi:hypothetical protein
MRTPSGPIQPRNGATSRRALVCVGAVGLLSLVAGCSSTTSMLSSLPPSLGGLPADAPARPPAEQTSFPAVHDMPPPRTAATLTPEQVQAVEAEIAFARARQKQQAKAQAPGASTSQTEER